MDNEKKMEQLDDIENGEPVKRNGHINNAYENGVVHEDLEYTPAGWLETSLAKLSGSTESFLQTNHRRMSIIRNFLINGVVAVFFFVCLWYWIKNGSEPLRLCSGFGNLIAFLTIVYFFVLYFLVVKRYFGKWLHRNVVANIARAWTSLWTKTIFRWFISISIIVSIAIYLYMDTLEDRRRLVPLIGITVILGLGFMFSKSPGRVNWRTVIMGLLIQFLFALLFIRWPVGRNALQCFSEKVATFLSYGIEGAAFVFGDFLVRELGVFAFASLPIIFFFSMLVEAMFFWGALQWFCMKLGWVLQKATGVTVCEGLIAVGNCFLGMTESILMIKPYVVLLTPSELHVVMGSGFATVSGTILATYIAFGASATHLVTASVMSAPAAICFCKLVMPETKRSLTTVDNIDPVESEDQSALSAAIRGATNGISLILNIIANLVAFVSCVALVNGLLGFGGGLLGFGELNLEWIFGKVFIPLSWIMGVPWEECEHVGSLIGLKTVVNEFVAYQRMGQMKTEGLLSPRGELIATYSLCGFTNPASAGIMIGALSAMAPTQRETLSGIAVRAFFAGCGVCFLNACVAGLLTTEDALY